MRRKFHDLYQAHRSPVAAEALERIAQLYGIEKEIRGRTPSERREVRQLRSGPLLESLHSWLKTSLAKLSRKSDVAVAIGYAVGRWAALVRYCDDGRIEMDNNAAERALRAVADQRDTLLTTEERPYEAHDVLFDTDQKVALFLSDIIIDDTGRAANQIAVKRRINLNDGVHPVMQKVFDRIASLIYHENMTFDDVWETMRR